jgi:Cutinase
MGTRYLSRWAVMLVPVVAAWLMPTTAATPAAHGALTPAAASAACPAAEIIGVHGTGEGPSSTDSTDSPEIKATFAAFAADEQKLNEHGARLEYYSYPTVSFSDYLPANWPTLGATIDDDAAQLETELKSFSSSCPDTPISLVGYSLGALLINDMLGSYDNEWNHIDAVELYGDPCWYNPHGGYRGLAQYAAAAGIRLGCFPQKAYPYRLVSPAGFPFAVQSLCISGDPICGQGWPPQAIGGQIIAATLCPLDRCPHLDYSGVSADDGANFLAEDAFKGPGGDG